jgi:hypothetical protein
MMELLITKIFLVEYKSREKMTSKTWILVRDVLCWNMAGAYPGFHKATPRKSHVRAKAENLFIS